MGMVRLRRREFHRIYRYRNYGSLMDIKPQWFNHKSIISDISLNKPKVDVEGFIKHNLGRVIDRHKERTDLKNKLQSEGTQLKSDICEAPIEFTPYTKIHSHKLQKPKKKLSDTTTSYFKIISISNIKIPKAVKIKLSTKNSIDRDEIHWQVITKSEELVITLCDSKQDEVNYDATKEESKSTREETTPEEEEEDTTYQEQCPAEELKVDPSYWQMDNEICHSDELKNEEGEEEGKDNADKEKSALIPFSAKGYQYYHPDISIHNNDAVWQILRDVADRRTTSDNTNAIQIYHPPKTSQDMCPAVPTAIMPWKDTLFCPVMIRYREQERTEKRKKHTEGTKKKDAQYGHNIVEMWISFCAKKDLQDQAKKIAKKQGKFYLATKFFKKLNENIKAQQEQRKRRN